jgi:hypothetical protein
VKCGVLFEVRAKSLNIYTSFGFRGLKYLWLMSGMRQNTLPRSTLATELHNHVGGEALLTKLRMMLIVKYVTMSISLSQRKYCTADIVVSTKAISFFSHPSGNFHLIWDKKNHSRVNDIYEVHVLGII